ncbi:MAG: hypothetical protein B7Y90_11855 [Alphaproteobacteria bacterium 32-64-14]|nr:MAG: hypothetical protein B7Y90_11855 [Alphaproteobacteria bacterium 32-64-14]
MLDDNLDEKVQMAELRGQFKTMIGSPMAFGMVDTNKDGGIDMQEFEAVMPMMRQRGGQQPPAGAKPPMGR